MVSTLVAVSVVIAIACLLIGYAVGQPYRRYLLILSGLFGLVVLAMVILVAFHLE